MIDMTAMFVVKNADPAIAAEGAAPDPTGFEEMLTGRLSPGIPAPAGVVEQVAVDATLPLSDAVAGDADVEAPDAATAPATAGMAVPVATVLRQLSMTGEPTGSHHVVAAPTGEPATETEAPSGAATMPALSRRPVEVVASSPGVDVLSADPVAASATPSAATGSHPFTTPMAASVLASRSDAVPAGSSKAEPGVASAAHAGVDLPPIGDGTPTTVASHPRAGSPSASLPDGSGLTEPSASGSRSAGSLGPDPQSAPRNLEGLPISGSAGPLQPSTEASRSEPFAVEQPGSVRHVGAPIEHAVPQAPVSAAAVVPPQAATSNATVAHLINRVVDVVEMLQNEPPPRAFVIDLPHVEGVQIRVALRPDGAVHLALASDRPVDVAMPILTAARSALADRGFDLAQDSAGQQRDEREEAIAIFGKSRRTMRPVVTGLRI